MEPSLKEVCEGLNSNEWAIYEKLSKYMNEFNISCRYENPYQKG